MIPLLITAFGLAIRLIRLDILPGEMWGDMFVHYHLIEQLNEGKWITGFMFGDGPIYSYIAFLVARVFGLSFYSLKLTSVLINCGFIWLSYSFGLVLSGSKRVAFLTSFLAAASFWSISFARTGWPNNLVPLFVEGVILCLWHRRYALAGIVAGSGLYTQAAAWGLGFFGLYRWKTALVIGLFALGLLLSSHSFLGRETYIGEKLTGLRAEPLRVVGKVGINLGKNLQSYFWQGDRGFRQTIPIKPHVDGLSGIFLLIGFGYIWRKSVKEDEHKWGKYVILPFLFLQIPSLLDIQHPTSTPNMSRMIGTLPLVFFGIAVGIDRMTQKIRSPIGQKVLVTVVVGAIAGINLYDYFWRYPLSLPNGNGAYGKLLATSVEAASLEPIPVVQVGCCWSDWNEPEYEAVRLQLKDPRRLIAVEESIFESWLIDPAAVPNRFLLLLAPDNVEGFKLADHKLRLQSTQRVYYQGKFVGLVMIVERNDQGF